MELRQGQEAPATKAPPTIASTLEIATTSAAAIVASGAPLAQAHPIFICGDALGPDDRAVKG